MSALSDDKITVYTKNIAQRKNDENLNFRNENSKYSLFIKCQNKIMSRRLRFQVKPNLNVANTPSADHEEVKSSVISSTASSTVELKTTHLNVNEDVINRRSPLPVPPNLAIASSSDDVGLSSPIVHSLVGQTINTDENENGYDTEPKEYTELVPAAVVEGGTKTDVTGTVSNENQAPPPQPPTVIQRPVSVREKLDPRMMRLTLKGKPLDRSTFLMRDLIYWKPEDIPDDTDETASVDAKSDSGRKRKSVKRPQSQSRVDSPALTNPARNEKIEEATPSAPQVKVNPDGTITIDELSLVVDRRDQGTEINYETIDETSRTGRGPRLNSYSFRRNPVFRGKKWSNFETDKFYRVLSFVGLDFTLMHELFVNRSRTELKRKYKKETINDPARIDRAIMSKADRYGPWKELKSKVVSGSFSSRDERSRQLLDNAKELIEDDDERILLDAGERRPTVQEACRIADRLAKGGFGSKEFNDDHVPQEKLQAMAEKILKGIAKRDKAKRKKGQPPQQIKETDSAEISDNTALPYDTISLAIDNVINSCNL